MLTLSLGVLHNTGSILNSTHDIQHVKNEQFHFLLPKTVTDSNSSQMEKLVYATPCQTFHNLDVEIWYMILYWLHNKIDCPNVIYWMWTVHNRCLGVWVLYRIIWSTSNNKGMPYDLQVIIHSLSDWIPRYLPQYWIQNP